MARHGLTDEIRQPHPDRFLFERWNLCEILDVADRVGVDALSAEEFPVVGDGGCGVGHSLPQATFLVAGDGVRRGSVERAEFAQRPAKIGAEAQPVAADPGDPEYEILGGARECIVDALQRRSGHGASLEFPG